MRGLDDVGGGEERLPSRARAWLVAAAWAAYAVLLWYGQPFVGPIVGAVALLPVMATGYLLGRRAGLAGGLAAVVATRLLLRVRGQPLVEDLGQAMVAYGVLVLAGWVTGWLGQTLRAARRQRDALGDEVARRGAAEEVLLLAGRATNDVIREYDVPSGRLRWGDAVEQTLGLQASALAPDLSSWRDRIHPEDRHAVTTGFEAALVGDDLQWAMSYRLRRADGSYADVFDRCFIVRDPDGAARRVVGAMSDVTQVKRVEGELRATVARHEATLLALRSSEARWRSLVENAPAFIITCDAAGRITFVNRTPAGVRVEDVLGLHPWDLLTGSGADQARQVVLDVLGTGRPALAEAEGPGPNGRRSIYAVHWSPIVGASGEVAGVTGMAFDVTEEREAARRHEATRAHAEALLRESRDALEQSNDGFFVIDARSGRFLDVTRKACADTGYPREDLLRMTTMDLDVNLPDLAAWHAAVEQVAASGGRSVLETELRRKDGVPVPVEISVRLLPGDAPRMVAVVRDVSARRQAEAHAHETAALRRVAALKTQFLSNAAHELATPLTPLKLQIATLRGRRDHTPNDRQALELLDRNVNRLGTLVSDLLDAARLQSGHLRLRMAAVALDQVAARVVASFRDQARAAGVTLGLHPVPRGLTLDCDETRLEQVLFNLVNNALKFTPAGGQVWLGAERDGDGVAVEVRDTGIGLAPEQIARLFQPFTQVHDPAAVRSGGTGLGLYIARAIAQQHGGDLAVHSHGPGTGSTFRLRLPLKPAVSASAPATAPTPPRAGGAPAAR